MAAGKASPVEPSESHTTHGITLGEFVKQLIAMIGKDDEIVIPFENAEPWHELFYELKKDPELVRGRPDFFGDLLFDWDGPYPKSRRLESYLQRLHWNASVEARNPSYGSIRVSKDIADIWRREAQARNEEYLEFLSKAADRAKSAFHTGGPLVVEA